MATKSAAQPPPAARRAVVLRAGPPQDKGRVRDVAIGLLGLLLLVLSGALVKVLPERDVLLPQFRVTVIDVVHENGTQAGPYLAAAGENEADITYFLPRDGIFEVEVGVGLVDDVAASYSDTIEFGFYDRNDTLLIDTYSVTTDQPNVTNESGVPFAGVYTALHTSDKRRFELCPRPEDSIVSGVREGETEAEVAARLTAEYSCQTSGTYRIHARLTSAGDCPSTQAGGDLERAVACQQETQGGDTQDPDPGNGFNVEGLTYKTFLLVVEKLES